MLLGLTIHIVNEHTLGLDRTVGLEFVALLDLLAVAFPCSPLIHEGDDRPHEKEHGQYDRHSHCPDFVSKVHKLRDDQVGLPEAETDHRKVHDVPWDMETVNDISFTGQCDQYLTYGDHREDNDRFEGYLLLFCIIASHSCFSLK